MPVNTVRPLPPILLPSTGLPRLRMDEFNYLIVLISIVLGLGITRLLTGLGLLIERRDRVRLYGPTLAWTAVLLLVHIQTWWSMFGMRDHIAWTFFDFLVVLLQPVVLYLLAVLVLPTETPEGALDLQAHYHEQARWFFGLFGALLVVSLIKDLTLSGALPDALNVAFHLAFFAIALTGAVTQRETFHRAIATLAIVLLGLYIAALFSRLD